MSYFEALSQSVISGRVTGERISLPLVIEFSRHLHFRNEHFPVLKTGTDLVHTCDEILIDNVQGAGPCVKKMYSTIKEYIQLNTRVLQSNYSNTSYNPFL